MSLIELFILAVGLSMDAFAVSVCKGLSVQKVSLRHAACADFFLQYVTRINNALFHYAFTSSQFFTSTTVAFTTCPRSGCGTAVTAHSSTAGWVSSALSTSNGPMR